MSNRIPCSLVCFLAVLLLAASPQLAGTRSLSWSPSAGADGYVVHYGDASNSYSASIDVGNVTHHTISGDLDDCTEWFFAVTAYNQIGESGYSPEVSWLTPMVVDAVEADDPQQTIVQGAQFAMTISGVGFSTDAEISLDHPDWTCPSGLDPDEQTACDALLDEMRATVRLEGPVVDCHSIQVLATVEPMLSTGLAARTGDYQLTVTKPGEESSTTFEVHKNPARFDVNRSEEETTERLDGGDVVWLSRLYETCYAEPGTANMPCSASKASPDFDPNYDFNGDGWIDGSDLADIASFLGACWDGATWKVSACP